MTFEFIPMNAGYARTIANWHYEGIYAFYDMDQDEEDLAELLNPLAWPERYYAVTDKDGALVGFFCYEKEADSVEIGLGMRPSLTGKGVGQQFVTAGLMFAQQMFKPKQFSLSVVSFNQRAIKVYEQIGFKRAGLFMNATNGGCYQFLRMTREA